MADRSPKQLDPDAEPVPSACARCGIPVLPAGADVWTDRARGTVCYGNPDTPHIGETVADVQQDGRRTPRWLLIVAGLVVVAVLVLVAVLIPAA